MKSKSFWSLENLITTVTAAVGVLGFVYGVYQFIAQQERSYRQKVYETQLDLYKEVMSLSSQISTLPYDSVKTQSFEKLSRKFDEAYYGKMTLLEDKDVEQAMIDFKITKDRYSAEEPSITARDVQENCLKLGYACRVSLESTWGIKLKELKRNKQ